MFTLTFTKRDIAHFLVAFVGAFASEITLTNVAFTRSALAALIPGALSVAFRQVFPNEAEVILSHYVPSLPPVLPVPVLPVPPVVPPLT